MTRTGRPSKLKARRKASPKPPPKRYAYEAPKPPRGRPGAPSKMTREYVEPLLETLRVGNFRGVACAVAGIYQGTFNDWMERGRAPDAKPHERAFYEAVVAAEAECESNLIKVIARGAAKDTKDAKWLATHRFNKRWTDNRPTKTKVEVTGAEGGPIRHEVDDVRAALDARLSKLAGRQVVAPVAPTLNPIAVIAAVPEEPSTAPLISREELEATADELAALDDQDPRA